MSEIEAILDLLARRCSLVYESVQSWESNGLFFLMINMRNLDVLVCLQSERGQSGKALSYVLPHSSPERSIHLNYWCRNEEKDLNPEGLVTDLWTKFWQDERRNQELGRMTWMHGPTLPSEAQEETSDVLSFFAR